MSFITFNKAIEEYIISASREIKSKKILDIGCGTGYYTRYFGEKNEVTGIDLMSCVQKRYQNFRFKKADATHMPFKSKLFDVVVSFDVIEHIEKDTEMVSEAYRVLKSGGEFIIGTPNRDRLIHIIMKIIGKQVKYPLYMGSYDDLGDMIHIREYTKNGLSEIIKKVGFKRVDVTQFWLGITTLGYGINIAPKALAKYSQYLFARGYK